MLKENIASITAVASTIGLIVGGWLVIDNRYAHAQALEQSNKIVEQRFDNQTTQIKRLRIDNVRNHYQNKIDGLKEKKIQLVTKPKQTDQDKSMIQFYDSEIRQAEINKTVEIEDINK